MRIIGIDPGLASLGWAIVESSGSRYQHIDYGTVSTKSNSPIQERLEHIYDSIHEIIQEFQPEGMGVETLFFTKNISSAIPVAQARGVVILTASQNGLRLEEYSPVTIKQSVVGSGSASKGQIQEMVCLLLGLEHSPRNNHAADALAAAITFINHGDLCSTVLAAD